MRGRDSLVVYTKTYIHVYIKRVYKKIRERAKKEPISKLCGCQSTCIIFKNLRFDFERKSCESTYRIGMFVSLHRNSLGSITCRKWHASESFPSLLHDFTHCISLQTVLTKCVQGINGQRAVRSRVAVQKIKVKSRSSFSFN
uniref:Uncharacterized protein n=1 Tax=Micrurus lemniscatus lemniscatus TaxID=129467 RepID=A0A2D4I3N0_MICLE